MTNLKGQLEALESGLIEADAEFVATLLAEERMLERLVDDFQQLALTDAGQLKLHLEPLYLKEAVENALAPVAGTAALTPDIPEDLQVRADEMRLCQVLRNLLENSIRHRPQGLQISVTARGGETPVTLLFCDNGPGVAAEDQPLIFERFYRAERSRNRATGGSGLGLTIARGILTAMGGTIAYRDSPD